MSAYYVPLLRQHAAAVRGLPAAQRASKTAAILAAVLDAPEPPTTVAVAQACGVSQPFVCRVLAAAAAALGLPRVPDGRGLGGALGLRVVRALADTPYAGAVVHVVPGDGPLEVTVEPPPGCDSAAVEGAVRGALGVLAPTRPVQALRVLA